MHKPNWRDGTSRGVFFCVGPWSVEPSSTCCCIICFFGNYVVQQIIIVFYEGSNFFARLGVVEKTHLMSLWTSNNRQQNRDILKVTQSPVFRSFFHPPIPLSTSKQCYSQSNKILLNMGIKWWNSTLNAQSSKTYSCSTQLAVSSNWLKALRNNKKTGSNSN